LKSASFVSPGLIGRERDISLRLDFREPLGKGCEMESYAVLPSVRRRGGFALPAAEIIPSTVRPASPLTTKLPSAIAWRTAPAGVSFIDIHRRGAHQSVAGIGSGRTMFDDKVQPGT